MFIPTPNAGRTNMATYPDGAVIRQYKQIVMDMLHLNFPLLTELELSAAVDDSISKHFTDGEATVDNNYRHKSANMSLLALTDYIVQREPILTSYGVLFNKHGRDINPLYNMIDGFISGRKKAKNEMFKYPKGTEEFEKLNLVQLLLKLDANAFYGANGQYSCIFYNVYVASSTTTQGRSCNAAAALFFESFLNNNVPMGSMNELIQFIHNVLGEPRTYNSAEIIDRHASIEETFFQLLSSTGFGWVPTEDEMMIVWEILCKLNQDDLDRLFYKNNLFNFIDNTPVKQAIIYILATLKAPFMNPNKPPEEIADALKEFCNVLKEYVYYDKQIIDRIDKMTSLIRSVSIIQDTDSAIISLDGWYRYVRLMCMGVPMAIKNMDTDALSLAESDEVKTEESSRVVPEYSFVDDEMIEIDRLVNPIVIIPQDGLRYSIINIIAYCMSILVNDYMYKYCVNSNSNREGVPCLITMKNEFLFKRILLTDGKKHYASKVEIQEGNIIPEEKSLDVKGIDALVKSTNNPAVQERLNRILYEDILNSEAIDRIQVLRDIAVLEKDIYASIAKGDKEYFKPAKVKSLSSYPNPMSIQGIKASYAYNALHEDGTEALDLSVRNSIDIAKVDMNPKNIDRIRDTHPEVYQKAIELFKTKEFATGVDSVAVPLNEKTPDWILPFIKYANIINDNVKGFPLESIGLYRGADVNNTTNIIHF